VVRYSGYPISAAQPQPPVGGTSALIAQNITNCTFIYNATNQRAGVISIWLSFADPGSTAVNLFEQIQVSNVP
jgi:MSHA biogenesis protein MshO